MADKSDQELQRMEGFTSRSVDSDIDVVNLSLGQMGCFDYIVHTWINRMPDIRCVI